MAHIAGIALVGLVLCLPASPCWAEQPVRPTRVESARGLAMAGGGTATAMSTHALADHPANVALGGIWHSEALFGWTPRHDRYWTGVALVDSITNPALAAGLSGRRLFGKRDGLENTGWEGRLALAFPISPFIRLGVAGRYADLQVADDQALAAEDGSAEHRLKHASVDASIGISAGDSLQLALFGRNLVATHSPLAPRQLGAGLALLLADSLSLSSEGRVDLSTFETPGWAVAAGGELLLAGKWPLRAGYSLDLARSESAFCWGMGYVDRKMGLDVGVRHSWGELADLQMLLGLRLFVQ